MIGAVICSQSFGRMPQLVWDVRSMESVLRFAYAAMVTSPGIPLKVCKNCGKVYYCGLIKVPNN